jgi:hypothetical protein
MSAWTFEDRARLEAEAIRADDKDLLARICWGDEFEPGLSLKPVGIGTLLVRTRAERKEWRERVAAIFAERDAIKARWMAQDTK